MSNIYYIIHLACAIWVIYDVVSNQKSMSGGSKALWIIFALLFSVITAIIYFFTRKK